jgi:hypothetical protein
MATDARFALLASMEHFVRQLQTGHLSEGQTAATHILLENARRRWAYLEMQDAAARGAPFPAITSRPAPIERSWPAVAPPAGSHPSASTAAGHPASA